MTAIQRVRTCACLLLLVPCCATTQTEHTTPSAQANGAQPNEAQPNGAQANEAQPNEAKSYAPTSQSAPPGSPAAPSSAPSPPAQSPLPKAQVPEPRAGAAPTAAIANPASEHCQERGGRVQIGKDKDGNEVGFCVFADGSRCEEWALFRGQCAPGTQR